MDISQKDHDERENAKKLVLYGNLLTWIYEFAQRHDQVTPEYLEEQREMQRLSEGFYYRDLNSERVWFKIWDQMPVEIVKRFEAKKLEQAKKQSDARIKEAEIRNL